MRCTRPRNLLPTLIAMAAHLACAGAWAQTAAPSPPVPFGAGDALRQAQPLRPETRPAPPAAPRIVEPPAPPLSLAEGQTLAVREFRFEGTEEVPEAELQALVAPYRGQTLSMARINEVAAQVTALYRSRGWLVARAYVPRQDASAGTLLIRVQVGRYGRFTLRNASLVGDRLLEGVAASLAAGQAAVSRAALERAMLTISDMPGAQLPRLTVGAGQAPGSADFLLDVPAGPRWGGWLVADNLGSAYTGKNRLSGGVELNSPLGQADKLTLSGMAAEGGRLDNGRLAYAAALAANGLRGELAWSKTTYELGGAYADLAAQGSARSLEAALSYPLLRSRERNLHLGLGLAARRLRDDIGAESSSVRKRSTAGTLGLRHEDWRGLAGLPGQTTASGALVIGQLDFDDPAQEALNRGGANTAGRYAYLKLAATAQLELAPAWSLRAGASVQKSLDRNLDPSEQMNIAGPEGVRAYRETVSGDNGYLLSAQLRCALPAAGLAEGFSHALGVFGDLGRVYLQHGGYSSAAGARLSDVGLGYHLQHRSLSGSLQVAHAVGAQPDSARDHGRTRVLLQAGLSF